MEEWQLVHASHHVVSTSECHFSVQSNYPPAGFLVFDSRNESEQEEEPDHDSNVWQSVSWMSLPSNHPISEIHKYDIAYSVESIDCIFLTNRQLII